MYTTLHQQQELQWVFFVVPAVKFAYVARFLLYMHHLYDLSPNDCKTCVSKLPFLSNHLCGKRLPSRIHLSGCYARYQAEDGPETYSRPDQLLHRACSKRKVKKNGFEEMKYAAFSALESGVVSGDGFFETTYEAIHVVAQCEGSLRACDCGECVYNAVQMAMAECRYSVSGEVYLDSCFISYSYYGDEHGFGGYSFEGKGSPKLVAITIGGLAVLILGLALCYFIKSCGKKKDDW
ncbi:hypothetical protein BUALT_Bualt06G0011700 [Buddleja alternifolia]|uniref:Gnk2-homologous domain-containing protein n=1 Tax=Buddleja alternifolia TaxID=168488 RepID=A0AAV6XD59_9LAMI|nr:hypothetical protein BUALT_Bualt06G0011700 [Buddleja alternifolia]